MIGRSVLIVGNGIAGPALAHWLLRYGFAPTIVEKAPRLRADGYIIDFWGLGYDLVEHMGLLPEVQRSSYPVREVRLVGRNGERRGGFDAGVFKALAGGRYTSLPRSRLSAILHRSVANQVRLRWDDAPIAFEQRAAGVWVQFRSGDAELFDVVVGADGLHSTVREQVFGEAARFERFLGQRVAAFEVEGYQPRDEEVYVSYGTPGRQVARFALRDDRTLFLLVTADDASRKAWSEPQSCAKDYLHVQFGDMGWELPEILSAMEGCDDIYFDRVSQIRMPRWSRGSIALLGDAAFAPSVLAGQGAALAIIGAYVLAGELSRAVTAEGAFRRYEDALRGFITAKQDAATKLAGSVVPTSRCGLWLRELMTSAFAIPGVAKKVLGPSLNDAFRLPEYSPGKRFDA